MSLNRPVSQRAKGRRKSLGRIEDFVLCVVVAVGIIAAVVLLAFYTTVAPDLLMKWVGFAVMTALVFGDTIRMNRHRWAQRRFWLLLGAFFGVQCGLGIVILWSVPKVSTMLWAFLIPLDYVTLGAFLGFFLESHAEVTPTRWSPPGRVRRTWQALRRSVDDFFHELP